MCLADRAHDDERGQSTAEYALVLAGIAGLVALVFTQTDVFQSIFRKAVDVVNKAIK
ncbi:MAG: Flp family type IVb pilin [Microthrixaceae bacterium]|nr:Flp family type IVb pilin [Microthrixaceae bacterium]